jgi:manganese/zinc/iron transport system permease protein
MLLLSAAAAALAAIAGHLGAIHAPGWFGFESTTSSGMIALASGLIFLLAWLFSPQQGIVTRRFRRDLDPPAILSETKTEPKHT